MISIWVDATLLPFENIYISCLYIMSISSLTSRDVIQMSTLFVR